MKVFLAGEGPTDIGDLTKDPAFRGRRPQDGFVQPIIRRIRPDDTIQFEGRKIMALGREGFAGLRDGLAKQASGAYLIAKTLGCDAVIVVHDVDRQQGERASRLERERRTAAIRQTLSEGLAAVDDSSLATGIGTPCRCIEAWALGDRQAVAAVGDLDSVNLVPREPEALWGAPNDPNSNHPKCVLRRLLGGKLSTEDYGELGNEVDPEVLRQSCPSSFPPFADDVESL